MAFSKAFHAFGVIDDLKRTVTSLREQWRGTRHENERLRRALEQVRQERAQLERDRERLREENEQLKRQLEDADAVIAVPPPRQCPCGGALEIEKIEPQYQHEIVRKTLWRRFDVTICRCTVCHQRVHGRDPRQTSDAFGAAAVQVGPDALAPSAVTMNKRLGMPHADVAAVLQDGFGLHVNRSTVCRAVERVARRGEATWHALRDAARCSLVNAMDETGWNVAAQLRWLRGRGQ